jgi:hypothetical protein
VQGDALRSLMRSLRIDTLMATSSVLCNVSAIGQLQLQYSGRAREGWLSEGSGAALADNSGTW